MGNSKLSQQVETARTKLEHALEAGSDTTQARADLDAALANIAAADAPQGQPASSEPDADIEAEADALAMEATKEISQRIETLCTIEAPVVEISVTAARDLISAKRQAKQAEQRLSAWQDRVTNLESRITETDRRRQSILARRLSGDVQDGDPDEIRALELDIGGLRDMLERLKLDRPQQPGVSASEVSWQRAKADAQARARDALIAELQDRLIALASFEPKLPFGQRCRVDGRITELTRSGVWG